MMTVNETTIQQHIAKWEKSLKRGSYPYRATWPSRLFRHEPVENAAQILKSGAIFSRSTALSNRVIVNDIAPEEIITHSDRAHTYVRLYFRPKNPTQYRIEGIKKESEVYYGKHAPVLIILVFKMQSILSIPGVEFSDGNMQSAGTVINQGDNAFQALPFHNIYHEGPFSTDQRDMIVRCRCAEVLVPDKLSLEYLQAILCRSPAERAYLLHLLGDKAGLWEERIRVYSKPGIFLSEHAYLDTVQCSSNEINFSFHPRKDNDKVITEIIVCNERGDRILHVPPKPLDTAYNWSLPCQLQDGLYSVLFRIDGCEAYHAISVIDNLPF